MDEIEQAITLAIAENSGSTNGTLYLGLSAGIDSTVLLHALALAMSQNEQTIKAIHVHHGISPNADAWAEQARALCTDLSQQFFVNIECIVEKVVLDDYSDGLEQAARNARYDIFKQHCRAGDVLFQGHHLDDQVETFFMRAIRGSGLTGLSGIPRQRALSRDNACQIMRPLLAIEKNKLIQYAKEKQLSWVEDESNQDSKIDRNWWRNELLPQIWQRYPQQKQAISRTIHNIQHEQRLLQQLIVDKLTSNTIVVKANEKIHPALKDIPSFDLDLIQHLDQAVAVSYLRAWLAQYVDILPSAMQMQSIYVDMIQARKDSIPNVGWSQASLYRYQNWLYLFKSEYFTGFDNTVFESLPFDWQGEDINCFWGQLTCSERESDFTLKPAQYRVRRWQAGDVAKPSGRSTRKMKKWWQDYGIPSWARMYWPIITDHETNEIVCVPGLFVCQGYTVARDQKGWLCEYKVKK